MGFIFQTPVTVGGTVLVIERIESQNYVPGTLGWAIFADGDAEFNDLTARGELIVGPVPGQHIHIGREGGFGQPIIEMYTGDADEQTPAFLTSSGSVGTLQTILQSPVSILAGGRAASLVLSVNGTVNRTELSLSGDDIIFSNPAKYEQAWTAIPLAGTWIDFAGARAQYFLDVSGRVQLRGQVSGGGGPGIGNLPVGYRPTQTMEWVMRGVGGVVLCAVTVSTAGVITATANAATAQASGIRLDSISFPAQF